MPSWVVVIALSCVEVRAVTKVVPRPARLVELMLLSCEPVRPWTCVELRALNSVVVRLLTSVLLTAPICVEVTAAACIVVRAPIVLRDVAVKPETWVAVK